ncbi:MAG: cation transporter, partial [Selenomonadales bacterium]|nr:cation transporter [Selenomonadales bacterium]
YLSYGIWVMGISIIVNLFVSERLMRVARKTDSQALEADALHLRADVWTSGGVLVGLVLMEITGMAWIDPAMAIIVAFIIFRAGYKMTVKSANDLTDHALPPEEEAVIIGILDSHEAVQEYHYLRTRKSGNYRFIDVHIVMDKNMTLEKAHRVSEQIEDLVKAKLSPVSIIIHMEPTGEEKTPRKR